MTRVAEQDLADIELRRGSVAVGKINPRHGAQRAEKAKFAGDDVEILRTIGFRIKRDVFRMFDQGAFAILQSQDEFSEWRGPDQALHLGTDGIDSRQTASGWNGMK
jgi:hypothetical protein